MHSWIELVVNEHGQVLFTPNSIATSVGFCMLQIHQDRLHDKLTLRFFA